METLKNYFFKTTHPYLVRVEALDEKMALAYKKSNDTFTSLCEKDKSLLIKQFTENENSCSVEEFSNISDMTKACKFLNKFIGTEYEIEDECITVFDMTIRDYQLFKAFLNASQ
jgi:hypothetical protein